MSKNKQIKSATGLEFVRGGKQPLAYDIRIINGATDQNQIIPFKYDGTPESPWQRYLNSLHNTWHPVEISMSQDIELFKSGGLTESEERLFRWNLSYLVSADSLVANNFILGVYEHITSPEARQYYMRQIFEEALHCYVEGTEVLTTEGWIKFEDLTGNPNTDPKVAQHHENGTITFVKYGEYVCDSYEGDVYEFKNKRGTFNKVVTPEHRCVVLNERKDNKLEIIKAEKLTPVNRRFPVSGLLKIKSKKSFNDMDCLFVAFQADGSIMNPTNNNGAITGEIGIFFQFQRKDKITRMMNIIARLKLRHTIKKVNSKDDHIKIYVWIDKKYTTFLTKDFDWITLDNFDKIWIFNFINELSFWDGCKRDNDSICYTNTNKKAIDKVKLLAHLIGKRAGLYTTKAVDNRVESYQLHIHNHSYVSGKSITKTKQSYKGNVYCVSVPTGMLMVRYKGAIMISGNTHSYQHIVESLGLDDEANAMFNAYREIDSIADKAEWNLNFTNALANKEVIAGTEQANRLLIDDLVAYVVFESLFFWCAFSHIFCLARNGKMVNTAEQYQYIMRDENEHFKNALWVLSQIKKEFPNLWDEKTRNRTRGIISEAVALEHVYAQDCFPDGGVPGLSMKTYMEYVEHIANVRCQQMDLSILFPKVKSDPLPWMDEMIYINKEKNFFESRVTEYRAGGSLDWDEDS